MTKFLSERDELIVWLRKAIMQRGMDILLHSDYKEIEKRYGIIKPPVGPDELCVGNCLYRKVGSMK